MICECAHRVNISPPINGTCHAGIAARQVTIQYNELERDVWNLCVSCAKLMAKDARRYGYTVTNRKLN